MGGLIEKVHWESAKSALTVRATTDDKKLFTNITLKSFDQFTGEKVGIIDTSKLRKMMGVSGDEIKMALLKNDKRVISLTISDDDSQVNYQTADSDVLPDVPKTKKIPDFEIEIELTDEFVGKFMKAKGALDEADLFTLVPSKDGKMTMVLGFNEGINNNRISMDVTPTKGKDSLKKPISFSAKALKEILLANSECDKSKLEVNEQGLARIEYSGDAFDATYYMIKIDIEG